MSSSLQLSWRTQLANIFEGFTVANYMWIAGLIIGGIIAFTHLQDDSEYQGREIEKLQADLNKVESRTHSLELSRVEIATKLDQILEEILELKEAK